jgi:hypothetical protein
MPPQQAYDLLDFGNLFFGLGAHGGSRTPLWLM